MLKQIQNYKGNKITLDELQDFYHIDSYQDLADQVVKLIEDGKIEPVKSSKGNGKKPPLYQAYRILRETPEYDFLLQELKYLVPELDGSYYRKHPKQYQEDREYVLALNRYLIESRNCLNHPVSINERSFEIFSREKFLKKEGGMRILKNLSFPESALHYYETSEPLSYYSHKKNPGQVMLIIENKDTFYSMRKHLLEGKDTILGIEIGTLIYGGGKAIYRSFQDFDLCVEPYMKHRENKMLYFGDLDYEGILIYEQLQESVGKRYEIKPFNIAYERMLQKAEKKHLPKTKEKQNRTGGELFFSYFDGNTIRKMKLVLEKECYIPQEILQCGDF